MQDISRQLEKKREGARLGGGQRRIDSAVMFLDLLGGRTMTAGDRA